MRALRSDSRLWRPAMRATMSALVPEWRRPALLRRLGVDVPATSYVADGVFIGSARVRIGAGVGVNVGSFLDGAGDLVIEDHVRVGFRCTFITGTHSVRPGTIRRDPDEPVIPAPVRIGRGSWIGAAVTVVGPVTIGEGCVIAAGSVVTRDCAPHGLYAGVPARRIATLPTTPAEEEPMDVRAWLTDEVRRLNPLPPPRLDDAARLAWIGVDAIGAHQLAIEAEDTFGITVSEADLEGLVTIGDVVALIERKRAELAA